MKSTENQQLVLDFLARKRTWISPSDIGYAIGGKTLSGSQRHSSWASPICKTLVKQGLVERDTRGWYKITTCGGE